MALLADIAHKTKRGVIMITHDTRLLDDVDTLYEMRDGQLKQLRDRAAKKVTPNPALKICIIAQQKAYNEFVSKMSLYHGGNHYGNSRS